MATDPVSQTLLAKGDLDALRRLGDQLAAHRMVPEASALFGILEKLDPSDTQVARTLDELAVARDAALPASEENDDAPANPADTGIQEKLQAPPTDEGGAGKQQRQDAIDSSHYLGLAALYADRGEIGAASECLEMAQEKMASLPYPYKLRARLLMHKRDFEGAAAELRRALRFNPFDRQTNELLGVADYECRRFESSLDHSIDALLLVHRESSESAIRLRRRIRTLRRILDLDPEHLQAVFRKRRENLQTAFDRLQWKRDLFLEEKGLVDRGRRFAGQPFHRGGSRIALAARLRSISQFASLNDEAIFRLTGAARELRLDSGQALFHRGGSSSDLYLLDRGQIELSRETPYGRVVFAQVPAPTLIGAVGFVDSRGRSMDARAATESELVRIEAEALEKFVERVPEVGAKLYAGLWKLLADDLRDANSRLKSYVGNNSGVRGSRPRPEVSVDTGATAIRVPFGEKVELFREQGLNKDELVTLAAFARERQFAAGSYLFREGDPGSDMYVIVEGRVRISQYLPGVGEEALAVLSRGDFFGEMSLIDGRPRSADARTHEGPVTALALDRGTLREVLSLDPEAATQFLRLLCRILAARLREVDEKLLLWELLTRQQREA